MNNGTYNLSCNFNCKNLLSIPGKIIIVGTAHVSEKSIAEVNEVIEREKPDIVAVELDKARFKAIKGEDEEVKEVNLKELLSGGKFYYFMLHWLLAYVQKKIGADTGVKPGAEMMAAIQQAEKSGAKIALIDRDIQLTLGRFWNRMSFYEKLKLFGSLVGASFGFGSEKIDMETVTNEDVVTQLIGELRKLAPSAAIVLIDERDAFMAKNLLDLSNQGKVVAVVGAGHREGIQKYLDAPETLPTIDELSTIPKKGFSWLKAITIAFILMIVGMLTLLVFSGGVSLSILLTAMFYLFVTQGILSAIGVLVARGHPLSALTAFSLAWFGFLHPFLAVGWLAGYVEAYLRPFTTSDLKTVMKAETFSELMNNKLFRIILVAGMANLGSMVGTFVAIPIMVIYLGITNPLDILKMAFETGLNALSGLF
ncbi:MAG: TraB/GumN family protein [Candidatus Methanoperedens sp.]|nr:TraB/GumN family protein [Candidatus Methanoperedens sp.]